MIGYDVDALLCPVNCHLDSVQLADRKLLRILRRPVLRNPKLCDLRVQPADPLHPFALVINQGILAKAFEA